MVLRSPQSFQNCEDATIHLKNDIYTGFTKLWYVNLNF